MRGQRFGSLTSIGALLPYRKSANARCPCGLAALEIDKIQGPTPKRLAVAPLKRRILATSCWNLFLLVPLPLRENHQGASAGESEKVRPYT